MTAGGQQMVLPQLHVLPPLRQPVLGAIPSDRLWPLIQPRIHHDCLSRVLPDPTAPRIKSTTSLLNNKTRHATDQAAVSLQRDTPG